ncbi:MAG: App1 family protein [Ginsengibacter sp.]
MKNIKSKHKEKKNSLGKMILHKIYYFFRIHNHPSIKLYRGFGNHEKIIVLGHTLKRTPFSRKRYRQNWITNAFSVIRLFLIRPLPCTHFSIQFGNENFEAESESDGFFRLEIFPQKKPNSGWHKVTGTIFNSDKTHQPITGHSEIYIPYQTQNGFISDIDDTFLISHSGRLRKRLYALLTKNERTRKPFEGVVNHYQQLAASGRQKTDTNPFFYVSSSEWNLYDFVVSFAEMSHLPKGVFLLGQLKSLGSFWKSGQNNHKTKFFRIVRIIEAYEHLNFVLLGDDSQQDPYIYSAVASHFPGRIIAVYIRHVQKQRPPAVIEVIEKIKSLGIECCYFKHSAEALEHSKTIGLITEQ